MKWSLLFIDQDLLEYAARRRRFSKCSHPAERNIRSVRRCVQRRMIYMACERKIGMGGIRPAKKYTACKKIRIRPLTCHIGHLLTVYSLLIAMWKTLHRSRSAWPLQCSSQPAEGSIRPLGGGFWLRRAYMVCGRSIRHVKRRNFTCRIGHLLALYTLKGRIRPLHTVLAIYWPYGP